ncbi:MAG TPA: zinc-binding dehydrogenase [Actinomycetota bacterium]|nr:zinc-binding dehydrogenase [Actinomycetota bacterium]
MEQVWIRSAGGPEVLEVREAPDLHPRAGQIRIAVSAAGVCFADVLARAGLYPDAPKPPTVVGYEVAGHVDEVGAGVAGLTEGERVIALTHFGGYSSSVVVPADRVQVVPAGKDLKKAAGLPVNFLSAYLMLQRLGSLRSGEWVLIHAAAGGIGLAALQLAKNRGAVTIGTAREEKHERLRGMGLDHAIDYRTQDFETQVKEITAGRGVDVALDSIGGTTMRKSYRCLAPLGRLFCFGFSAGAARSRRRAWRTMPPALATTPLFHPLQLMNANKGVFGFNLGHLWDLTEELRSSFGELIEMWALGQIDPVIDSIFPFERAGEAHAQLEDGRNFGKVLLVPTPLAASDASQPGG